MKFFITYIFIGFIYSVNFSQDISPIIFKNCTSCHRPNEIGAFLPFENFQQVYDNRYLISYAISYDNRHGEPLMPPWPPDREFSTLLDERFLTDSEIQIINDWIEIGAPQGNPEDEYPIPNFPDGSTIGDPDAAQVRPENGVLPQPSVLERNVVESEKYLNNLPR